MKGLQKETGIGNFGEGCQNTR